MIAVILAAALALSPTAAPATTRLACTADQPLATGSDRGVKPRKLGVLPDGVLLRTVLIKVGDCPAVEERLPTGLASPAWRWTLHVAESQTVGPRSVTPAAGDR